MSRVGEYPVPAGGRKGPEGNQSLGAIHTECLPSCGLAGTPLTTLACTIFVQVA